MKVTRTYWRRDGERLRRVDSSSLGVVPGCAIDAHDIFNSAKARGEVTAPLTCSRCEKSGCRIFGHHEDYDRPLDVIWLCAACHAARHVELRVADAEKRGLVVITSHVREPGDPDLGGCTGCGMRTHNWRTCSLRAAGGPRYSAVSSCA